MKPFLNPRLIWTAALFSLGGCAYVTPYPSAFPIASASDACALAVSDPGNATKVNNCLIQRGRGWDERGVAIRRQAGFVGQMSIPLGIAGLGLSAGGDRSDFVPISAGVTSASLAHTGAYARPTQAEVYELATVSYRCLISAVADWNSAGKPLVDEALSELDQQNRAALEAVRNARYLDETVRSGMLARLLAQRARAHQTNNRLDGGIGTALLRQSDAIDAAVIRAIRDRLPDPQTVAASITRGPEAPPDTPGVTDASTTDAINPPPGAVESANLVARRQEAVRIAGLLDHAQFAGDAFDAAVAAYSDQTRTVGTICAFNPSLLPVLTATPTGITVDSAGKGFFIVRNGVPPYGHLPLPAGVSLTPTPLGGNAVRFEVTVPTSGPATGPWEIHIFDASPAGSMVEVSVAKAS